MHSISMPLHNWFAAYLDRISELRTNDSGWVRINKSIHQYIHFPIQYPPMISNDGMKVLHFLSTNLPTLPVKSPGSHLPRLDLAPCPGFVLIELVELLGSKLCCNSHRCTAILNIRNVPHIDSISILCGYLWLKRICYSKFTTTSTCKRGQATCDFEKRIDGTLQIESFAVPSHG